MMVWYDTAEKYIGQWSENLQNGFGVHIWYEPKGELKYLRNRYVGEWFNGKRNGYGVFFYSNGGKYEGMWADDYKDGFGVLTFQNGSQYIGKFQNDRMVEVPTDEIISMNKGKLGEVSKPSNQGKSSRAGGKEATNKDTTSSNFTKTRVKI